MRSGRWDLKAHTSGLGMRGKTVGSVGVGNIGAETRAKYGVVGRPINLAARIESYSLGGDVLIDEATRRLRSSQDERVLMLTVAPTFATEWLVPRLLDFQEVRIKLVQETGW